MDSELYKSLSAYLRTVKEPLEGESGLSLVEVLVGAVIFALGFSVLVVMLSNITMRISPRELMLADAITEEILLTPSALESFPDGRYDTLIHRSGLVFEIRSDIVRTDGYKQLHLTVTRQKTGREISDMFYVFEVAEE